LVRKWLDGEADRAHWARELLTPTRIYVDAIMGLREVLGEKLTGLAHITGSGLLNVPRMNPAWSYHIDQMPTDGDLAPGMAHFFRKSELSAAELARTFNCGVGMVLATSAPIDAMAWLQARGEKAWVLGEVREGEAETIHLRGVTL
jgi:phosphoribosylaminoimidazole (AIR) synthetase